MELWARLNSRMHTRLKRTEHISKVADMICWMSFLLISLSRKIPDEIAKKGVSVRYRCGNPSLLIIAQVIKKNNGYDINSLKCCLPSVAGRNFSPAREVR